MTNLITRFYLVLNHLSGSEEIPHLFNSYLDYDREWTNPTLHSLELRICTESVQSAEDYKDVISET